MINITKDDAIEYFRNREKLFHVDERVFESIKNSNELKIFDIEDKDLFMSLIWQEVGDSRILTPRGKSRTLADITKRMRKYSYNFSDLSAEPKKYQEEYSPSWFNTCKKIDKEFDFDRFGWLVLVLPNKTEQDQSPNGKFYIYDGVHRSLVLANRLFLNIVEYQKIKALLVIPRPV